MFLKTTDLGLACSMHVPSMEEQRSIFQIIGCKGGYALPCIIGVGYPSESAYYPEEYLKGKGKEYSNIPNLKAYGQAGKPCSRCGTIIRVILFIEK